MQFEQTVTLRQGRQQSAQVSQRLVVILRRRLQVLSQRQRAEAERPESGCLLLMLQAQRPVRMTPQMRGPILQDGAQDAALLRRGAGKVEAQQTLPRVLVQHPRLQLPAQPPFPQRRQQATGRRVMQRVQQQRQGGLTATGSELRSKPQMQRRARLLQTPARCAQRQQLGRRRGTNAALAPWQRPEQGLGDGQQLFRRLWPDQGQAHAPGPEVAPLVRPQRLLKMRRLYGQGAAIPGQELATAMPGGQCLPQCVIDATFAILAACLVLGM